MKRATKEVLSLIVAYYCVLAGLFGWFAYANWKEIDRRWWFNLTVATAAVFGFLVPPLGRDLRRPKVFLVLTLLFAGHMAFCVHYLKIGVYVRPLLYAPIGVGEIFLTVFALIKLGGATLDDYRNSLSGRGRK